MQWGAKDADARRQAAGLLLSECAAQYECPTCTPPVTKANQWELIGSAAELRMHARQRHYAEQHEGKLFRKLCLECKKPVCAGCVGEQGGV